MIRYRSGYKYQLAEDYTFELHPAFPDVRYSGDFISVFGRTVTLHNGYACDGPSGPTIDTKTFMRASFEHDGTFQLIRKGIYSIHFRKYANVKLRETCKEDGMAWVRRQWVYFGLKVFSRKAASSKSIKPVETAP